jgi:predicted nucleic acid-binding protein
LVRAWIVHPPAWCEIRPDPPFDPALDFLDPGERAAIALAISVHADRLLIDEQDGRAAAEERRLPITGTLGVLADAHIARVLDFETALAKLRQTSFYASAAVVDHVRRRLSGVEKS